MQTLLDQMIKDLILAAICAAASSSLTNIKYWSMNYYVAIAIIWAQYISGILFFGQILSTFITRYIIIYHPSMINDVDERRIMAISRYVLCRVTEKFISESILSNIEKICLQDIDILLLCYFNNLRNLLS